MSIIEPIIIFCFFLVKNKYISETSAIRPSPRESTSHKSPFVFSLGKSKLIENDLCISFLPAISVYKVGSNNTHDISIGTINIKINLNISLKSNLLFLCRCLYK